MEKIEEELARARAAIREAILTKNCTSDREEIYVPSGSIYKNPYAFHQLSFLFFLSFFLYSIQDWYIYQKKKEKKKVMALEVILLKFLF